MLAHDRPDQLRRLISRLADGESTFWLHLDARVEVDGWWTLLQHPAVVLVEPRVQCVWVTWSVVEAQSALVRACLGAGTPGYLVMLSGQSYPLKSNGQIDAYLERNSHAVHTALWSLPERWPDSYRDRLDYFCIVMSDAKGDIRLLRPRREMNVRELVGWTRRLVRDIVPKRALGVLWVIGHDRPDVADRLVGGSQWWAVPWAVAESLVQYHELHPEYADFVSASQFGDESFFQTIMVAMDPGLRERVMPSLTHVDWTEGDWDLPRVMGPQDVTTLLAPPEHVLFARKFVSPESDVVLQALDEGVGA